MFSTKTAHWTLIATIICAIFFAACSSSPDSKLQNDAEIDTVSDTDMDADAFEDAIADLGCASHDLGSTVPVTYSGTTEGRSNFVTSVRLEWGDEPDDALIFTAPTTGDYAIEISGEDMDDALVSAQEYLGGSNLRFFTPDDCPPEGEVIEIDAYYSYSIGDRDTPLSLQAGQSILMFISTPDWNEVESGPYTITIRRARPAQN